MTSHLVDLMLLIFVSRWQCKLLYSLLKQQRLNSTFILILQNTCLHNFCFLTKRLPKPSRASLIRERISEVCCGSEQIKKTCMHVSLRRIKPLVDPNCLQTDSSKISCWDTKPYSFYFQTRSKETSLSYNTHGFVNTLYNTS